MNQTSPGGGREKSANSENKGTKGANSTQGAHVITGEGTYLNSVFPNNLDDTIVMDMILLLADRVRFNLISQPLPISTLRYNSYQTCSHAEYIFSNHCLLYALHSFI